ncbi:D-alanyl-D-alanine carboxypeptidase family protein [Aureimonas populi]|uniref:D-alanyl-D-alanine carboxypeptidase family protein n=2 Tax=Aureimonas populi TaxID=1701758 RepID=A0ABW5CJ03_9HYPH
MRFSLSRGRLKPFGGLLLALLLAGCQTSDVFTARGVGGLSAPQRSEIVIGPAEIRGRSALVIDASTGRVLLEEDADGIRFPASLTKLMTLYLLFEAVEAGRLSLDDQLLVSADAASRPPAKLGVPAGSTMSVRDAIIALAVRSANDVAAVVAENLAGSEERFAQVMTARARALGMSRTRFVNASGLPDERQVSTARDMARLAATIRTRFPRFQSFFEMREFTYAGRRYLATNKLLGDVPGVDGMKTGYIRDAGFHLVATVQDARRPMIVVVMGGATGAERDRRVKELIDRYR